MTKPKRRLSDMEFDEISLVDKGANQFADVLISKRATEEETMPDLYYEDGGPVDESALKDGDIVYDAEGQAYKFEADEDQPELPFEETTERESELVGKSAFLNRKAPVRKSAGKSFADEVRAELSKALTDTDRDEVLSKAFGKIEELEQRQAQFAEIAKSERDLRLTREYVSKAAEYNLPVDPSELGPVLYRMAESMSYEDCSVIAKCLETAGEILFQEIGFQGGGDNADVMSMVETRAVEIGKSATAESITAVFDENPGAYDEYLSAQRGVRF